MNRSKKIAIGAVSVLAIGSIGAGVWLALDDDQESSARGVCGAVTYELSVEDEDDITEVSFELQSGTPDETWDVEVRHDATTVLQGARATDSDGEIDLDVPIPDDAREIDVIATASEGERCTAMIIR